MTELFLPYHLAVIAKDLGFLEQCLAYYKNKKLHPIDTDFKSFRGLSKDLTAAPLYQQITDWLYKNHKIDVVLSVGISGNWKGYITINKGNVQECPFLVSHVHSKEELLNDLVEESFKLINK